MLAQNHLYYEYCISMGCFWVVNYITEIPQISPDIVVDTGYKALRPLCTTAAVMIMRRACLRESSRYILYISFLHSISRLASRSKMELNAKSNVYQMASLKQDIPNLHNEREKLKLCVT